MIIQQEFNVAILVVVVFLISLISSRFDAHYANRTFLERVSGNMLIFILVAMVTITLAIVIHWLRIGSTACIDDLLRYLSK